MGDAVDAGCGIVIAGDRNCGNSGGLEFAEKVIGNALSIRWRVGNVENVAGNQHGIDIEGFGLFQNLFEGDRNFRSAIDPSKTPPNASQQYELFA